MPARALARPRSPDASATLCIARSRFAAPSPHRSIITAGATSLNSTVSRPVGDSGRRYPGSKPNPEPRRLGPGWRASGLYSGQFYTYTDWGRRYLRDLNLWHCGLRDGPRPEPGDYRTAAGERLGPRGSPWPGSNAGLPNNDCADTMALEPLFDLVSDLVLAGGRLVAGGAYVWRWRASCAARPGSAVVSRDDERLVMALVVPAAMLHAADGDPDLRVGGDRFDRAVLLSTATSSPSYSTAAWSQTFVIRSSLMHARPSSSVMYAPRSTRCARLRWCSRGCGPKLVGGERLRDRGRAEVVAKDCVRAHDRAHLRRLPSAGWESRPAATPGIARSTHRALPAGYKPVAMVGEFAPADLPRVSPNC